MATTKKEFGIGLLRGNLFWLVVCQCIWGFTTNIPSTYLPLYIQKLGGSVADVGYVKSIAALAGLFLYPLGGYIADKSGRVKLVNYATFGYALSFIPYALAQNWQTVAFAAFFQSFVLFYNPILTVLMSDSMPVGRRAAGFGLAISIPQAVSIFAPSVGGYLVDSMGLIPAMRSIYSVGLFAGIFVALLRRATLKETLDPAKIQKIDWSNIPKVFKDSYSSFFETVKWMPSPIKILAAMQVTQIFFNATAGSMWIVYATGIIGITATQWGLTSAIQGLTRLVVAFNAGSLMDKYGRRKFLIPFMFLVPLYPLLFTMLKDWASLAGLVVAMAITNAFLISGFQSLLADWVPRERRGRVTSTVGTGSFFLDIRGTTGGGGMLLFLPASLGQALGGTLYMQNPVLPFYVCSAGMVIVAIWGFLKVRDPKMIEK
jgi:MFS family permease